MTKFLFKANDDVISHCTCPAGEARAMSTAQLDCPWCGCGWLIPCVKCGKSFTYGVIKETDMDIMDIARTEVKARNLTDHITEEDIKDWAKAMAEDFNRFDVGQKVIYLDGSYFPLDAKNIEFDGYFAHHKLETLPHAEAIKNPSKLKEILYNKDYWFERELPERE